MRLFQSKMAGKAVIAYIVLFIAIFASYFTAWQIFDYLIPFLLVILPAIAGGRISFSFSGRHFIAGAAFSLMIILPYFLFGIYHGRNFIFPDISMLAFQLLVVSIPEEIFFRGFIQEAVGNNLKGNLITSLLFSIAHLPNFLFNNDIYSLLTFFPSLIIGYIYMRTANIMPCIMFHFFANVVWVGFG